MRFTAVLLVAITCSTGFASEPGQPEAPESAAPPASAQSKATPRVRQAEDADLIVKEWHSPITFELYAAWLAVLPMGMPKEFKDIPSFFCDHATLETLTVTMSRPRPGITRLRLDFDLSVQESGHDKLVDLEFTLLSGDVRLPLGRESDFKVAEGRWFSSWVWYEKPDALFAPYLMETSETRIRVSMIVRND